MKIIDILKEQVFNTGLNTLLKRLETILSEHQIEQLTKPIITSAEITDIKEVTQTIKSIYTCFNIKDIELDIHNQNVTFKIYGSCYISEKYRGLRVLNNGWSDKQTDEYNYLNTIKEEYAEKNTLPINIFNKGIKVEII